jgi:hypothetical protein
MGDVAKKFVGLTWKANGCVCIVSTNCSNCIQIRQLRVVQKFYEINREAAVIPLTAMHCKSSRHVGMHSLLTARQIFNLINNHAIVEQSIMYLKPFNRITICLSECIFSYHFQFEDYYYKHYCLALSKLSQGLLDAFFDLRTFWHQLCLILWLVIVCVFLLWQWQIVASVCQVWTRAVFAWN